MKKTNTELSFGEFNEMMQRNFEELHKDHDFVFTTETDKDVLWNMYLDSFPKGTNEIYREKREFDCSCCRGFIKQFGNIVFIKDNKLVSIWDFKTGDFKYDAVTMQLSKYVKSKKVQDVYISNEKRVGTVFSFEEGKSLEDVKKWEHFNVNLPDKFINTSGDTIPDKLNIYRTNKQVFERSLTEISNDAIETVLELISQNSLYKGSEWKGALDKFFSLHKKYHKLRTIKEQNNFCWIISVTVGGAIAKIKNHSIGTLLMDITEGTDLDQAVKKYEAIVAPTNYKRPKAIFTKKMLEDAKKTVEELGYGDSLQRRYAILSDIPIGDVEFVDRDARPRLQGDVFEEMKEEVAINPKQFDKVEVVPIEAFIENVLPTAKHIEVYFDSKHSQNMASMLAPFKAEARSMFKWNNALCWVYSQNITDSGMKQNVKSAGGNVDGALRFSIQWNDEGKHNKSDYDAHCIEPNGNKIFYENKGMVHPSSGRLDVDILNPDGGIPAVENITWLEEYKMGRGTYKFLVHNYTRRSGDSGFRAEIEFRGQIHKFNYNKDLKSQEKIYVAEVEFDGTDFKLINKLPSETSSVEMWGLKSNNFIPVSIIMLSPNYWNKQQGIGNKHFMFMLKGCVNDESPNGFFNEFLSEDLMKHKRVFEALGSKMKVETVDNQLSGLGFSSTKRDSLICKVEGAISRVIKIVF